MSDSQVSSLRPSQRKILRSKLAAAIDAIERSVEYGTRAKEVAEELAPRYDWNARRPATDGGPSRCSGPRIEWSYPWRHVVRRAEKALRRCNWADEADAIDDALNTLPTGPVDARHPELMLQQLAAVRAAAERVLKVLTAAVAGLDTDTTGAPPAVPKPATVPPTGKKRSTERGEARAKLVAALTAHHRYNAGSCLNCEPIGCNELARMAGVASSTVSEFFTRQFEGHARYRRICADNSRLITAIQQLNGELPVFDIFRRGNRDD